MTTPKTEMSEIKHIVQSIRTQERVAIFDCGHKMMLTSTARLESGDSYPCSVCAEIKAARREVLELARGYFMKTYLPTGGPVWAKFCKVYRERYEQG